MKPAAGETGEGGWQAGEQRWRCGQDTNAGAQLEAER